MDYNELIELSHANEIRIDTHENYTRVTPHYYNSLRQGFGYYFNTYITTNAVYNPYAKGLSEGNKESYLWHQVLDEDNTQFAIISFQIFFELFVKRLLFKTNPTLTHVPIKLSKKIGIDNLISHIEADTFIAEEYNGKKTSIPFSETIRRFYGLIELSKIDQRSETITKFNEVIQSYNFLDSDIHQATLKHLNWYRNRILHNGNSLPSLWLLDYMVTQLYIPIIKDIVHAEREEIQDATFYLKTVTDIDILGEFEKIKFQFSDLENKEKFLETFHTLLKIGHLKELGRANINMNLFTRYNQATYEIYYRDVKGRGLRFAKAEQLHPDFKEIKKCPCCGEVSLTVYKMEVNNLLTAGKTISNDWVKCYTCDYHILLTIGEPLLFGLSNDKLLTVE